MSNPIVVARARELEHLNLFLKRVLEGTSQVCLIVGEAGTGKSALAEEFIRRAQKADAHVVAVIGTCDPQASINEPYLPFRQVLARLTGDVDIQLRKISETNADRLKHLARQSVPEILFAAGPLLAEVLIPGARLAAQVAIFAAKHTVLKKPLARFEKGVRRTEIDRAKILEQYTAVIVELAKRYPLILILDDLHWADTATIALFFHLTRQLHDSRVLIVGTYRPTDVALGRAGERHPLEPILNEIQRYHGDAWIDLTQAQQNEGLTFVNALIDTEPNRLNDAFRSALFAKTRGHPLFTVELLRDLQEHGHLVHDEQGRWITSATLNWDTLPARVEGVIAERFARLPQSLREVLTTASVEGERFTLQVIARVLQRDELVLAKNLAQELEQRHRLVQPVAEIQIGKQVLAQYEFAHALFQQYLYDKQGAAERRLLHHRIGEQLQSLYTGQTDSIAAHLAHHFAQAGDNARAVPYFLRVAEQANLVGALHEARASLMRGLELVSRDDQTNRMNLLVPLGENHEKQGDFANAYARLQEGLALARAANDTAMTARALSALCLVLTRQGKLDEAIRLGEEGLALARAADDPGVTARALRRLGFAAYNSGDYAAAARYHEEAVTVAREIGDQQGLARGLDNVGLTTARLQGYAAAMPYFEEALAVSKEMGDKQGIAFGLNNLGLAAMDRHDYSAAMRHYVKSLGLWKEIGDRQGEASTLINLGRVATNRQDYAAAKRYFEEALNIAQEIEFKPGSVDALYNLGTVAYHQNDGAAAIRWYEQAAGIAREIGLRDQAVVCTLSLGFAFLKQGEDVRARQALFSGLRDALALGSQPRALFGLVGIARLYANAQQYARAAELLGLATSQAAISVYGKYEADQVLGLLRAVMPASELESALERGKQMEFETVAREILN